MAGAWGLGGGAGGWGGKNRIPEVLSFYSHSANGSTSRALPQRESHTLHTFLFKGMAK